MAAFVDQQPNMFLEAVHQIFNSWPSLLLAVEQGFGGPESKEKADWMATAIDQWFRENPGLYEDEVEDFLNDVLNTEFDLRVEDGSVIEISRQICLVFKLCQENNVSEIQKRLQALPKANTSTFRAAPDESTGEMESDSEENTSSLPKQYDQSISSSNCSQPKTGPLGETNRNLKMSTLAAVSPGVSIMRLVQGLVGLVSVCSDKVEHSSCARMMQINVQLAPSQYDLLVLTRL